MRASAGREPQETAAPAARAARPEALAGPARVLALQRTAGNAAVARYLGGRRLARDPDPFEQIDLTGQAGKYMLKPPKAIQQQSLTCWAAALASFLDVTGADHLSFEQIISRYIATACIDDKNALDQTHAGDVFAEWGVEWEFFQPPHPQLTGEQWREKLRVHGHLLLASRHTLGHVVVVYGSGFDDKGAPNPDWISVMDPIVGGHRNWHVSAVANTMSVGWLTTKRTRPAACLSQPPPTPVD